MVWNEHALNDLIGLIYDAACDERLWPAFLARLSPLIHPEAKGVLMLHDSAVADQMIMATANYEEPYILSYAQHYGGINPWLANLDRPVIGRPYVGEDLLPAEELAQTEFFNDWLRPQGLARGPSIILSRNESQSLFVSTLHPDDGHAADSERLRLLGMIAPHLKRASEIHRQIGGLNERSGYLSAVLNRLRQGAIVVDGDGRVLFCNAAAETILRKKDGLTVLRGRVVASRPGETEKLLRLARATDTSGDLGAFSASMLIDRPSGLRPFTVSAAPLRGDGIAAFPQEKRATVLFVNDPDQDVVLPAARLQRFYRLTPAEIQVVQLVVEGHGLPYVAEALGISLNTVRTHLKRIMDKTGTSRQAELVRLVIVEAASVR